MMQKALFISCSNLFSFSRYLNFCPNLFGNEAKRLVKKAKINFKIYDITDWVKINYNIHIAQYLTKKRRPSNEVLSANRIQHE